MGLKHHTYSLSHELNVQLVMCDVRRCLWGEYARPGVILNYSSVVLLCECVLECVFTVACYREQSLLFVWSY